ncbi:unnamed protein product [Pylaiella littoralis]
MQKLKAEIASFPRRLRRGLRRYFDDKVVWVTGADHGIGEELAINLTVNGARVILSGTDLDELERVQRLCILAWMKAVNWEIRKALRYGLTRRDRVMVLPLDVRDDFILEDAALEAESMLNRPMDMVFHCQTDGGDDEGWDGDGGEDEEEGSSALDPALEAMSANLWGAVGLTKVLLLSMLDRQEGHVVVFGGDASFSSPEEERSAEVVASQLAVRGYFDSLRAEVARDRIKVTTVHQAAGGSETPGRASQPAAAAAADDNDDDDGDDDRNLDASITARRVLAAVAKGRPEVLIQKRGLFELAAGLTVRTRCCCRSCCCRVVGVVVRVVCGVVVGVLWLWWLLRLLLLSMLLLLSSVLSFADRQNVARYVAPHLPRRTPFRAYGLCCWHTTTRSHRSLNFVVGYQNRHHHQLFFCGHWLWCRWDPVADDHDQQLHRGRHRHLRQPPLGPAGC